MPKVNLLKVFAKSMAVSVLLLVGCIQIFNPNKHDERVPKPGTKYNQTNSPIGGGKGYKAIITEDKADYIVRTMNDLNRAIKEAASGEIIFIPGDAVIDFTSSNTPLKLKRNITLASNRGYKESKGALLVTRNFKPNNLIEVTGDSVRITGLRIEGPDKEIGERRDARPRTMGILVDGFDGLEVDNSEIFGWSLGGIFIDNSEDNYLHHNHIHLNRRKGLGYGIVLYSYETTSNALIEANYFRYNRHSIAGSGQLGVSYEARYNYVTRNTTSHSFDMHGDAEKPGSGTKYAGNEIRIYRNTFNIKNEGIVLRGIPKKGAWIYENNFLGSDQDVAIRQRNYWGNMHVYNNQFKGTDRAWYVSWGGQEDWYALKADPVGVSIQDTYSGDFNGDQVDDLLFCYEGNGYLSKSGESSFGFGKMRFINLDLSNGTTTNCTDIYIGKFDDVTKDQLLKVSGRDVLLGSIDQAKWKKRIELPGKGEVNIIRVGDFNGNGLDDLFAFDGQNWFVSYELSGEWKKFKEEVVAPQQVLVGKFSGAKTDDILMLEDRQFTLYSFSANIQSAFNSLDVSESGPFIAGDFDADGVSELLNPYSEVTLSMNGESQWQKVRILDSLEINEMKTGDFNGDGITDIIVNQKALW